jgi:exosortase E/protease (VPEID-CTERM system)
LAIQFCTISTAQLWSSLSDLTLTFSAQLLHLVSSEVVYDSTARILGTPSFQVEIAASCSGYEGIALVLGALVVFVVLFRKELRFPHALLLLPIGVSTIWFCNVLRIVALILIGDHLSANVALGGFHSHAGWIGFAAVTLVIGYIALSLPWFTEQARDGGHRPLEPAATPAAAYLVPQLALLSASMIAGSLSSGFDTLYPLKVVVGSAALAYFYHVYQNFSWSWSWLAAATGVLVYVVWRYVESLANVHGNELAEGLAYLSPQSKVAWIVFRVFGAVIMVPLAEELAFRGYLLRRIMGVEFETIEYRRTSWFAVAVSSLLFGLLHRQWLAGTAAGICYALAARRRGFLCDAIVAHSVTNGMLAINVLLTGSWKLWS